MKHKILILIVMCLLPLGAIKAQSVPQPNLTPDEVAEYVSKMTEFKNRGDSSAEAFIKVVAKIKMEEVNYVYISTAMFKQIFSLMDEAAEGNGNILASIKSMRSFASTSKNSYKALRAYMDIFLFEIDEVFGMQLQMVNKDDDVYMAIYSDDKNLLVINDDGDTNLYVVFIAGLSYELFMKIQESGFPIMGL
ncbi:MAG: hypothetical protein IKY85_02850 [Bacteroidaceae bacterium]|nr:hypothetical protein [Bacteroidaceae bacterium]